MGGRSASPVPGRWHGRPSRSTPTGRPVLAAPNRSASAGPAAPHAIQTPRTSGARRSPAARRSAASGRSDHSPRRPERRRAGRSPSSAGGQTPRGSRAASLRAGARTGPARTQKQHRCPARPGRPGGWRCVHAPAATPAARRHAVAPRSGWPTPAPCSRPTQRPRCCRPTPGPPAGAPAAARAGSCAAPRLCGCSPGVAPAATPFRPPRKTGNGRAR
ncbi:hypothetical protein FQZ97_842850 [compost metagenome]